MTAPAAATHWLDQVHPEYEKLRERWTYTRDHYTAEVLDAGKIRAYLHQKAIGESTEAYQERQKLADYTNFLASAVDAIAGMLWANDEKTNRQWKGEGAGFSFGDPGDARTLIGRLYRDADGRGLPYITLWKGATVDLLLDHRVWVLADTMAVGTELRPVLRILPALSVPLWATDREGFAGVVVKEEDSGPTSLETKHQKVDRRIAYTRTGWQRWEKAEGGTWVAGEQGTYAYRSPAGAMSLPIFRVDLPLRRHVGWTLAKKANVMFNQESARDNLLRLANFPRLNLVADDTAFDNLIEKLRQGANALQVKPGSEAHGYIAPSTEPAAIAGEVLKQKRDDFFAMALKEYGDAARDRTATEVRQDVAAGVGAFLSLLASALDAAENGAIWRLAQTERPGTESATVQARVERSSDFATVDPEAAIDKLRERVFGDGAAVPLGNEARVQAALQVATYLGLEVKEEEVRQAVALAGATDTLKAYQGLPLVAPVRVQMLKLLLESTQLLKGAKDTEMADGQKVASLEAVLQQALELAEAEDEQARRSSEFLGAPGPLQIPAIVPPAPVPAGADG